MMDRRSNSQPQPVAVGTDQRVGRRHSATRCPFVVAARAAVESVSPSFIEFTEGREPQMQMWVKANDPGELSIRDRQVALAHLSDGTLLFNSVARSPPRSLRSRCCGA